MKFQKLTWVCLSLGLLGCPKPPPAGDCGGYACAEGQRCESSTLLCVTDEPPVITLIKPASVVSTPTFQLTGKITDDVAVTSAEWHTGVLPWQVLALDPDGNFSITVDSPLVDTENAVVNVRASDALVQVTADAQVLVDRVGPSLRLVAPGATAVVGTATVDVRVEAVDGSGSLADLKIAGTAIATPRSGVAATITVPVPTGLDREVFSVEATAADPRGNRTTQTFSLLVDRVPPTVSFFAPAANHLVSTASFSADVQVTDRSAIQSVVFHLGPSTFAGTNAGGGHWTVDLLTSVEDQFELVTVEATDAAGNVAPAALLVHVDRLPPTLTVTAPAAASLYRAGIPVAVTTSSGTDWVTATLESQTVTLTGDPTSWAGTLTAPQRDFSSATVHITASDLAGNLATSDVVISVDTVAPVIAFTAPTANQKFNASNFASGANVTVSWTVADGDAQAATTTVNGAASTALTTSVPTTANDNPVSYTSTVVAADRAGNTATASVSYSVDRVVPTVVNWTPANGARNVEPRISVITFSEPVSGPLSTSPALTIAGQTAPVDFWYPGHSQYDVTLESFRGRVLDVSIANVADAYGNPVASATRRFHLATTIPAGTVLASGVSTFAASSDADGSLTVAYLKTGGQMAVLTDVGGTLMTEDQIYGGTRVTANSWNTVNPTTLVSVRTYGVSVFNPAATVGSQYSHLWFNGGLASYSSAPVGAEVSHPPLAQETTTLPTGEVLGANYTRGTFTRTLPTPADMVVAQGADSWAVVSSAGNTIRWSRYRCSRMPLFVPARYACEGTEYGSTLTAPITWLEAAMTRSGNCLLINFKTQTSSGGVYQRLENCDADAVTQTLPASCISNTAMPGSSGYLNVKIAPFSGNGEDTLLFAYPAGTGNPSEFRLEKMTPGLCAYNTTHNNLITVPNVREFAPIQVGNKAAFLYVDTNNDLRVYLP